MIRRLLRFLFPPSPWKGCHAPTAYERMAAYERRLGEHKAQNWMRNERIAQVFDSRATVQAKVAPKLPADNVVKMRRRK
jgi:hypothetical protein